MITNDLQMDITNIQIKKLQEAKENFDLNKVTNEIGSKKIAEAQLDAIMSEIDLLKNQVYQYEGLKNATVFPDPISNFEDIPKLLIQTRISKNLNQTSFAEMLGISVKQLQRDESENYQGKTLNQLLKIAELLGIDLNILPNNELTIKTQNQKAFFDWSKFPLKVMKKRGWFDGKPYFYDKNTNPITILSNYFKEVDLDLAIGLHRKHIRSNAKLDAYSVIAWECRVMHLASKMDVSEFNIKNIDDDWISTLVKLSKFDNGPLRAKSFLAEAGIKLVFEPCISKTYLDGAALLIDNLPVIGLTLRYDRLDNFWFVLLHEISHIVEHLFTSDIDCIIDVMDYEEESLFESDEIEKEADLFASESLIPSSVWNNSIVQFTQTKKSIIDLAKKLDIHPSIVVGRLHYETKQYFLFRELLGNGEVRKLFPEINFG